MVAIYFTGHQSSGTGPMRFTKRLRGLNKLSSGTANKMPRSVKC